MSFKMEEKHVDGLILSGRIASAIALDKGFILGIAITSIKECEEKDWNEHPEARMAAGIEAGLNIYLHTLKNILLEYEAG